MASLSIFNSLAFTGTNTPGFVRWRLPIGGFLRNSSQLPLLEDVVPEYVVGLPTRLGQCFRNRHPWYLAAIMPFWWSLILRQTACSSMCCGRTGFAWGAGSRRLILCPTLGTSTKNWLTSHLRKGLP